MEELKREKGAQQWKNSIRLDFGVVVFPYFRKRL
jgi:hypothetical protein